MRLAFRGAPFHGWQSQPGVRTVQSVLEDALTTILRISTPIVGAGRTDAGVNASKMVAHFDAAYAPEPGAVNALVAPDIVVSDIRRVADDAHARFDAISRTYHYKAVERRTPFLYPLTWFTRPLDYVKMNEAAELLLRTDDFTSFAKLHSDTKTNICKVTRAEWVCDPTTGGMTFVITANRFLRNMVRAVVGTLVEVGRGKMTVREFADVIAQKNRCAAGTSMPGHALYLADITYPAELFEDVFELGK